MKAKCRLREKQPEIGDGPIEKESEAGNLFMASNSTEAHSNSVWLIDSGCSNHMIGDKLLFRSLDKSLKISMRLGDNKEIKVLGVGTIIVNTQSVVQKKLHGVLYVLGLAHNLLSVGLLLTKGYSIVFKNDKCIINDNQEKNYIITISRSSNILFPLNIANVERLNIVVKSQTQEEL